MVELLVILVGVGFVVLGDWQRARNNSLESFIVVLLGASVIVAQILSWVGLVP